eukprot:325944-Prymnesium_polylepis.1
MADLTGRRLQPERPAVVAVDEAGVRRVEDAVDESRVELQARDAHVRRLNEGHTAVRARVGHHLLQLHRCARRLPHRPRPESVLDRSVDQPREARLGGRNEERGVLKVGVGVSVTCAS